MTRTARIAGMVTISAATLSSCDLVNPTESETYEPSRLPVGELAIGVWLPAGLTEYRFADSDRQRLLDLGVNQLEWVQRAEIDGATAEQIAMEFCSDHGLRMPVYYEPPGFTPYDKLHNWATRTELSPDFEEEVRRRVFGLRSHWESAAGFGGYLIGHEDYARSYHAALSKTVGVLQQEDPLRPALTVGNLDSYQNVGGFLDAFFVEGSDVANIFQHEHYVFRQEVPQSGSGLQDQLSDLASSYGRVARKLQSRNGRWHAIVQAHGESREGLGLSGPYYRKPSAAEVRVQVGLALARGAAGIIYFLYSSGVERVLDSDGELIQERVYDGLVSQEGDAKGSFSSVSRINEQLQALSTHLASLHFHGGYGATRLPANELIAGTSGDLDIGLFGNGSRLSHALVVNVHTDQRQEVVLTLHVDYALDALSGTILDVREDQLSLDLEAGGFQLLDLLDPSAHSASP